MSQLYIKLRQFRFDILLIVLFLIVSYSVCIIFDKETVCQIGEEDGMFEYLTALFFLGTSILLIRAYITHKNWFFLLLSIVMFIGFGEEISWGQRIIGFSTPDLLEKVNVQHEFTLHNIEAFNWCYFDRSEKTGLDKLSDITYLFRLFCFGYGFLLPIASLTMRSVFLLSQKIRLPVPPLSIGVYFLFNMLINIKMLTYLLPAHEVVQYYDTIGEIHECTSAFIFLILSCYFFKKGYRLIQLTDVDASDHQELPSLNIGKTRYGI